MAAITYTNQPNAIIGYPMWDYFSKGKGVLLGAYTFGDAAFIAAAKPPEERIKDALEYGSKIHPQYKQEFDAAWRWPGIVCPGRWAVPAMDGRRPRRALRQSLRAGWPHRAGGRTCLAHSGLAGRRGDIGDWTPSPGCTSA